MSVSPGLSRAFSRARLDWLESPSRHKPSPSRGFQAEPGLASHYMIFLAEHNAKDNEIRHESLYAHVECKLRT